MYLDKDAWKLRIPRLSAFNPTLYTVSLPCRHVTAPPRRPAPLQSRTLPYAPEPISLLSDISLLSMVWKCGNMAAAEGPMGAPAEDWGPPARPASAAAVMAGVVVLPLLCGVRKQAGREGRQGGRPGGREEGDYVKSQVRSPCGSAVQWQWRRLQQCSQRRNPVMRGHTARGRATPAPPPPPPPPPAKR